MSQRQIIGERPAVSLVRAPLVLFLLATALFVISAVVQQFYFARSLAIFNGELQVGDGAVDPMQQIEDLARGSVLVTGLKALGLVAASVGVLALPLRNGTRRGGVLAGAVAAVITAVSLVVFGVSSLRNGTPQVHEVMEESTLASRMLMLVCMVGLLVAALCWRKVLVPATICCFLLLGSTVLGSFIGWIVITPLLMNFASDEFVGPHHWVVLVSTIGAALAMLCAAGTAKRRSRQSS